MPDTKMFIAPFVGGLNTEYSKVTELPLYTSEELNCTLYSEDIRGRRYGMDAERYGQYYSVGNKEPESFQGYLWKNVGKTSIDYIVYQVDTTLHFYYANEKPFSASKIAATLDLSKYVTDIHNSYLYPFKFISGAGTLIVVSKYLTPVQITYNFEENKFTATPINILCRDIEGVDDGLAIDEMPTTLSYFHNYNLRNQGWSQTNINNFNSAKSQYPSNNLQWFIGKDSSGNYNTEELLKRYFGNTPAPKGHFILNYFDKNRAAASGIYGGSARTATWAYRNTWTSDRAYNATVIRSFSQEIPGSEGTATAASLQISRMFRKTWKRSWGPWNGNVDITIQGLKSDGTWVQVYKIRHYFYGTEEGGSNTAEVYLMNFNNTTAYLRYRFQIDFQGTEAGSFDGNLYNWPCGITANMSLSIAEDGDPFQDLRKSTTTSVTDVAYMSGRFFYLIGDTVLFSQVIKDDGSGYNLCYQDADPTSEEISDMIETDGGYVKFQTMGDGLAIKTFNRGVLVFGRDMVNGLISPTMGRFTATEYDVLEISRAGLIGPQSVVSIDSFVYYWSPVGIFRIGVNQNTGTNLITENISQDTIQSFYNAIPRQAKENCRGCFDYVNNRIYWYYPTNLEELSQLDGVLVLDLNKNAFMPQKISEGAGKVVAVLETLNSHTIEPTLYLRADGERVVADDKYAVVAEDEDRYNRATAIAHCIYNKDLGISFGDYNSREYIDWDKESFDSYLVSHPMMLEGISSYGNSVSGTFDNKQVPILQTLFKRTEQIPLRTKGKYIAQSGVYLRMRWGWSLNERSNRWDLKQNAYRPQKDFLNDEYVESRIHVRGRGKSYQIEIRNDGNKDFRLAGVNLLVRK